MSLFEVSASRGQFSHMPPDKPEREMHGELQHRLGLLLCEAEESLTQFTCGLKLGAHEREAE